VFAALLWSALGGYDPATAVLIAVAAIGALTFAYATRARTTAA
jgi:hypothetical protein